MSERSIFLAALEIADPADRELYLDQACGNDAKLRQHIEELIAAEAKLGKFLNRPHAAVELTDDLHPVTERPGSQIGPYKLREQLGEGGFGVVYVAEQEKPVRRKVALKIIKPGMDTKDVIARFEAERQALALMDHPNVARVLDAGATDSGRPYFVMELVHGVPITEFCDKEKLPTRDRLLLFADVCRAVQHAHQKGIIHRDLKPSNIMVTLHDGKPVAKVIDFGVSKALSQQLTEKSIYTAYGQMIGTPSYMSPEQAEMSGLGIDTRSDIYSLGVLLYELLTGKTPLDARRLREGGYAEMLRMIREEEPPRPSLKISTLGEEATSIAQHRHTDPHQLRRSLRGELDWIVMKCLEKDRSRRYETAIGLARDVERYLQNEPVEAGPPTLGYRLSKFTRRHMAPLAVAAGFLALLLVGIAASSWQAIRATVAERTAADSARSAHASEQVAKRERDTAQQAQTELRSTLYAAEMNLTQVAWENRQYVRVQQLLADQPTDLRGFEWHYWRRKLQLGRLKTVAVPQFAYTVLTFGRSDTASLNRDGTRLAAILDDPGNLSREQGFGLLAVFDSATGRPLFPPVDPFPGWTGNGLPLLTMNGDGSLLAVTMASTIGSREDSKLDLDRISLRDGHTGREIRSLQSSGFISEITLSPDGSRLAACYGDERRPSPRRQLWLRVWDTSTGKDIQTLEIPRDSAVKFCWSPDGQRLAWMHYVNNLEEPNWGTIASQQVRVVEVASGKVLWRRDIPVRTAARIWTWSPNGKWVVAAIYRDVATAPTLQLLDSDTGQTLAILDRDEAVLRPSTIAFSPDCRRVAGATGANEIQVWELPDLAEPGSEPVHLRAPNLTLRNAGSNIVAIAFSGDGRRLHSAAERSIVTWDALAREDVTLGPESSTGIPGMAAISADGSKVAFSTGPFDGGECRVWDLAQDRELCCLKQDRGQRGTAWLSPNGRQITLVKRQAQGDPLHLVVHDSQTGHELGSIPVEHTAGAGAGIISLCYRNDGKQIAAKLAPYRTAERSEPGRLMAWDADTKQLILSAPFTADGQANPRLIGYSTDGRSLVVAFMGPATSARDPGDSDRVIPVVLYDAATGQQQRSIPLRPGISPLPGGIAPNAILAIGPRPSSMLRTSDPNYGRSDIVVVDFTTGQERLHLRGHEGFDRFSISPDGSRLALGKSGLSLRLDSEVSVWSLRSGKRLLTFNSRGACKAVGFSQDGNQLIGVFTTDANYPGKTIQIWDAAPLPEEDAR